MTKEQIRDYVDRLVNPQTGADISSLLEIFKDFLFRTMQIHNPEHANSVYDHDAMIVGQMVLSKILHLERLLEGVEYVGYDGGKLNPIIDPIIIAATIRTIYETVGMFNTVNVLPDNPEQRLIVYNLWVIAGLNDRQVLGKNLSSEENKAKYQEEKQKIINLTNEIEQTSVYRELSVTDKQKIQQRIKSKEYGVLFGGKSVKCIGGFQDAIDRAGIREIVGKNSYKYLSTYAHPSNVAVFQFAQMFKKDENAFIDLAKFNLRYGYLLIAMFIADYIKVFPETREIFENMDLKDQCVINLSVRFARGEQHVINNSLDSLE